MIIAQNRITNNLLFGLIEYAEEREMERNERIKKGCDAQPLNNFDPKEIGKQLEKLR